MEETSPKSSTARVLAVVALAICFVIVIVIVSSSFGGGGGVDSTQPEHKQVKVLNGTKLGSFWTVRPGQSLSTIAAKVGISVERLQTLNPSVDPQALHEGERIRIKPKS
jgi:LysM repeat protein